MRSSPPLMPQALLARVMLALLLLFAQQQAATHWLSHVAEAKQLKANGSTPVEHCDDCLAFSALGAAPTAAPPTLPGCGAHHVHSAPAPAGAAPAALALAFRSRAPPILS